jgi:hypothetical protein
LFVDVLFGVVELFVDVLFGVVLLFVDVLFVDVLFDELFLLSSSSPQASNDTDKPHRSAILVTLVNMHFS